MESTVYCQERQCEEKATFYITSEARYVWYDHKNSQYIMEQAIEIIDPQIVRSTLKASAASLENLQWFSEDYYNESNQHEVNNLCATIWGEYEIINSKLGEAEKNNEAFKYKAIGREAMQLLMNLNNQKIYVDYCQNRTNDYDLRPLKGSNEEANLQIKNENMSKFHYLKIFLFECLRIRIL